VWCSCQWLLLRWDTVKDATQDDPIFLIPAPALRTLNAHRDNMAIISLLPENAKPLFRLGHRALRCFCMGRGIFVARFGYLSSVQLVIMLVSETLRQGPDLTSASKLLQGFFATYGSFRWEVSDIAIPGFPVSPIARDIRSPMSILSIHRPQRNLAENVVLPTRSEISTQFSSASQMLKSITSWGSVFQPNDSALMADRFLHTYSEYIRIRIIHWGRDPHQGYSLIGYCESQLTGVR